MKSCFFIGHRDIAHDILPQLCAEVERHICMYGVTEFIVGHYGAFDRLAASAVITAKKQHPEITLSLLIPYHPAERPIAPPPGFDNTFYPPGMENVPRGWPLSAPTVTWWITQTTSSLTFGTRQVTRELYWNTLKNGKHAIFFL